MNIFGKTTISPFLFITGKTTAYVIWIIYFLELFQITTISHHSILILQIVSYIIGTISAYFIVISLINLGTSTRFGIPRESTEFKTQGLYQFSRNPMYLGFNLLTLAAMLYTGHPIIIGAGIYSIMIYHLIILGEEKFLEQRFGEIFKQYKKQVRRYI